MVHVSLFKTDTYGYPACISHGIAAYINRRAARTGEGETDGWRRQAAVDTHKNSAARLPLRKGEKKRNNAGTPPGCREKHAKPQPQRNRRKKEEDLHRQGSRMLKRRRAAAPHAQAAAHAKLLRHRGTRRRPEA
jgi:hypothetical protein